MNMSDYEVVKSYLNSLYIHCSRDWVLKCIEDVKSSNPFLSSSDLRSAVYHKWLLVNLRDFKVPCLPANLVSCEKITLTGSYAVQMESMVDSSKSSYSELCKIRNVDKIPENDEESKEEVVSKRCLVFVFCDGVQEIQGMEYQYIPSLKLNDPGILPGIKVLIVGPVICRKGMLLLKKENVKIYGGKVDSLCEKNCLESLLCKKLGLNFKIKESSADQIAETEDKMNNSEICPVVAPSSCPRSEIGNIIENDIVDEFLSDDDDEIFVNLNLDSNNFKDDKSEKYFSENKSYNEVNQDQFRCKTNINSKVLVHENENQLFNTNNLSSGFCKKSPRQKEIEYFGKSKKARISNNDFGDDVCEDKIAVQSNFVDEDLMLDSVLGPSTSGVSQKFSSASSKEDMAVKNFQSKISSYLLKETKETHESHHSYKKSPLIVSAHPFVYLKQTLDINKTKPGIFIVKAIILTLKSKIITKGDEFSLKAVICDGSYAIQVNFSSDILENIMEYSPCEIASFMSEKNINTAVREKLKAIFLHAQQKLLSMNCLMEVKFYNDGRIPLIVGLEEIQLKHVNALKKRMLYK